MKTLLIIVLAGMGVAGISCHRPAPAVVLSCCAKESPGTTSLRADPLNASASIYQIPGEWTDQHGKPVMLEALKGKVQVVAMIFTQCGYACPRLVEDMKNIQDSLTVAGKKQVGFVLVSFDSERDDPAQLSRYAALRGLDSHWVLLHGSARQVRALSMLLNVKYQALPDGNFSHSNAVFILDREGAVRQTMEGLASNAVAAVGTIDRLESR